MGLTRTIVLGCTAALGSFAVLGCESDTNRDGMGAADMREKSNMPAGSTGTQTAPGQMRSSGPGGSGGPTGSGMSGSSGSMNGGTMGGTGTSGSTGGGMNP